MIAQLGEGCNDRHKRLALGLNAKNQQHQPFHKLGDYEEYFQQKAAYTMSVPHAGGVRSLRHAGLEKRSDLRVT